MENEKFVVIVETKNEEPMVWEQYLSTCSYEEALERMKKSEKQPNVLRVAVAKLEYAQGNRTVLQ